MDDLLPVRVLEIGNRKRNCATPWWAQEPFKSGPAKQSIWNLLFKPDFTWFGKDCQVRLNKDMSTEKWMNVQVSVRRHCKIRLTTLSWGRHNKNLFHTLLLRWVSFNLQKGSWRFWIGLIVRWKRHYWWGDNRIKTGWLIDLETIEGGRWKTQFQVASD